MLREGVVLASRPHAINSEIVIKVIRLIADLKVWSENSKQAGFFLLGKYFSMIKSLQYRQADLQQNVIDRLVEWQNISPSKSLIHFACNRIQFLAADSVFGDVLCLARSPQRSCCIATTPQFVGEQGALDFQKQNTETSSRARCAFAVRLSK